MGNKYVRELVDAGVAGMTATWRNKTHGAVGSVQPGLVCASTAIAAGIGLLGSRLNKTRSVSKTALCGLAAAAVGFGAAWLARDVPGAMVASARKNIDLVRDAHWLEKHPITYA